ncbi:hypothetical protein [Thermoactinomyces sp. DSM 45892]|uniref:hypothetical protein n=1 Tax=Thermoactinomyces sp. DSM 45892 TaxID=1882753 RepID=UPI00089B3A97|nr:hypothetical protein [Thermoactinomyces sp. DSM 45892]SDZ06382.1 hypothetical protein SAMN05444416_112132 [Thermoactinomyces sp. DSM 45892]
MNNNNIYVMLHKDCEYYHPDFGIGNYFCEDTRRIKEDYSHFQVFSHNKVVNCLKTHIEGYGLPSDLHNWIIDENNECLFFDRLGDSEGEETTETQRETMYYARYYLELSQVKRLSLDDYHSLTRTERI